MLLLNFGHPLIDAQLSRVRELAGRDIERIIAVSAHFGHGCSTHRLATALEAPPPRSSSDLGLIPCEKSLAPISLWF